MPGHNKKELQSDRYITFDGYDELHYLCDGFSIHIEKNAPNIITLCNLFDSFPNLNDNDVRDLKLVKYINRNNQEHEHLHAAIHLKMRGKYNLHAHYMLNRNLTFKDFEDLAYFFCKKLGHAIEDLVFGQGLSEEDCQRKLHAMPNQLFLNAKAQHLQASTLELSME